jgi:hypothetical protein
MCHIDDCERPQYCKGLCRSHYYRLRRYGDPTSGTSYKDPRVECAAEGCYAEAMVKGPAKGYCHNHRTTCKSCGSFSRESLCSTCSAVIRASEGRPEILVIAAKYLERNHERG